MQETMMTLSPRTVQCYGLTTRQTTTGGVFGIDTRTLDTKTYRDIAREAYDTACAYIEIELQGNIEAKALIHNTCHTMNDVQALTEQAKARYDATSQSGNKALKWLGRFSSRVTYYGQVLDVLAQHHAEYVSLVWGVLKFIFMVSQ
jgi:hypothetical protein